MPDPESLVSIQGPASIRVIRVMGPTRTVAHSVRVTCSEMNHKLCQSLCRRRCHYGIILHLTYSL